LVCLSTTSHHSSSLLASVTRLEMEKVREYSLTLLVMYFMEGISSWLKWTIFSVAGERLVANVRVKIFSNLVEQEIGM
jgi:ABC transporter transmembrane region